MINQESSLTALTSHKDKGMEEEKENEEYSPPAPLPPPWALLGPYWGLLGVSWVLFDVFLMFI